MQRALGKLQIRPIDCSRQNGKNISLSNHSTDFVRDKARLFSQKSKTKDLISIFEGGGIKVGGIIFRLIRGKSYLSCQRRRRISRKNGL